MPEPAGRRPAVVAGPHDVEQDGRVVVHAVRLALAASGRTSGAGRRAGRSPASGVNSTSPATFEPCAAVDPGADHQPLRRLLRLRERLVVQRDLPRPRVVPAGDVQHGDVGVVGHVVDDRHPLDLPERRLGAAPHRLDEPRLVLGDDPQRASCPARTGRLSTCSPDAAAVLDQGRLERRVGQGGAAVGGAGLEDPVHEPQLERAAVPHPADRRSSTPRRSGPSSSGGAGSSRPGRAACRPGSSCRRCRPCRRTTACAAIHSTTS